MKHATRETIENFLTASFIVSLVCAAIVLWWFVHRPEADTGKRAKVRGGAISVSLPADTTVLYLFDLDNSAVIWSAYREPFDDWRGYMGSTNRPSRGSLVITVVGTGSVLIRPGKVCE